ncbi:hypothetical protein [Falsigemmobacter faecalis]|uniref:Uncharacterized protein n=1 Tax=Falsigemmobacter faecalis TaxID=2488730 RepID=A0A3P3DPW1_9RHOB|nr:hypothetical protein [Falsigemmobacter faecalis]RRH76307.1 hypothetical protein EG244_05995 [Falsigemmobacter faecalis]
MTEQTRHAGADEVLSSLRRLVTEEPGVAAAVPPLRLAAARPARLMLTPALRVDGPAADGASQRLTGIEADLAARDADLAAEEAPFITAPEDSSAQDAGFLSWPDEPEAEAEEEARRDEEILRSLIRDVLREELQGDLGERVTRNIRRIVRAEVARVLAVSATRRD